MTNDVSIPDRVDVLISVADALEYAHSRGVVHLDVKPANILRTEDGTPRVADWGLARVIIEHTRTQMGLTPPYSAPEQLTQDHGDIDRKTDIYQLGVLGYQVLTGELPFDADRPVDLQRQILEADPVAPADENPALPRAVDEPILRALAKDQADRYDAAVLLRNALQSIRREEL